MRLAFVLSQQQVLLPRSVDTNSRSFCFAFFLHKIYLHFTIMNYFCKSCIPFAHFVFVSALFIFFLSYYIGLKRIELIFLYKCPRFYDKRFIMGSTDLFFRHNYFYTIYNIYSRENDICDKYQVNVKY